ncbi:hypothetical protein A9Q86_10390 [Flavobacteriales bacterium 33_180_T64]|nr:hypothetical protein A9Q86_10390 [Flavobacteriales bacterium 33_180_T64]
MIEKLKTNISEIALTYTRKVKASDRPKISCSADAHKLFRENWDDLTINPIIKQRVLVKI